MFEVSVFDDYHKVVIDKKIYVVFNGSKVTTYATIKN